MKQDFLTFLNKVADMRTAQRAYFAARKAGDAVSAPIYLARSKELEREVDLLYTELSGKLKNGEQGQLF